jgi:hypothetical protein
MPIISGISWILKPKFVPENNIALKPKYRGLLA